MQHFLRYALAAVAFSVALHAAAQSQSWRELHKVKKKETIYGIARQYGITEEELRKANPEMNKPDYKLKKGEFVYIPYPAQQATVKEEKPVQKADDIRQRAIRVGIMLPLHDVDGDGRRMIEYYRGLLMACNDLKREGISADIRAWNVNIDADIRQTLQQEGADKLDIIFGPLYTKQMEPLSKFVKEHGIRLVVPFSINGRDVESNPYIYKVYQTGDELNTAAIAAFMARFGQYHVVFIDCNDKTSTKGNFTFGLRKRLEEQQMVYNITNLNSSDEAFAKAFVLDRPNIVVLNTGRSPELTAAMNKLDILTANNRSLKVSLFGYQEWLMYEKLNINRYHKYDAYVPTYYYYNTLSGKTQGLETYYRQQFGTSMINAIPRFGITGYDHATFFLRGLHKQGSSFTGEVADKEALQTQLRFRRVGKNGGMKNSQFMLVHYNTNKSISTIVY